MLHSIAEVLFWDLEAYIPLKAVPYRADQLSYLKAKAHMLLIEPCVGDWLKESEDFGFSADSQEASNIREWRRAHGRATKLPLSLVERFEKVRTIARDTWVQARIESKFVHFKSHLEEIVELTRKKADLWGYEESPYDALIEDYEPGTKASQLMVVFEELRIAFVGLLGKLTTDTVSERYLEGHYPIAGQQALLREVAAAFGYDLRGRQNRYHYASLPDLSWAFGHTNNYSLQ
jgi:carboxypeptidase Taq